MEVDESAVAATDCFLKALPLVGLRQDRRRNDGHRLVRFEPKDPLGGVLKYFGLQRSKWANEPVLARTIAACADGANTARVLRLDAEMLLSRGVGQEWAALR